MTLGPVILRMILALFMGLIIQWSQMHACLGDSTYPKCAEPSSAMSCCKSIKSCHCAEDTNPEQKPAPVVVVSVDLKLLLSKPPENDRFVTVVCSRSSTSEETAISTPDWHAGFAGVPLSVAFCRFLI
jgi:hypothetical protein